MQVIDGQEYSWNAVAPDILSLRNRLGFGNELSFLHVQVGDDGMIMFKDPITNNHVVIKNEAFTYKVRRVLFYYSKGNDSTHVTPENEVFTKISLLDDSMHLGCSTNQHRIENAFQALFDKDRERSELVFERYFNASRVPGGDVSFRVLLLPRIPAKFTYHAPEMNDGVDSATACIPSSMNIFFEKHANLFLPPNACESLEDIFLHLVQRVMKNHGGISNTESTV